MCKAFQSCFETCYWHLIEKRFCYDESIAMYNDEPETIIIKADEKNNNMMFDNMAFYDSVAVIAGRAIVTIDPSEEIKPIVRQPTIIAQRLIRWHQEELKNETNQNRLSRSVPTVCFHSQDDICSNKSNSNEKDQQTKVTVNDTDSVHNRQEENEKYKLDVASVKRDNSLKPSDMIDPQLRRKSLRERRMSKSLYLKIDFPKELPLIRQQSMPKFYLDTPDEHQTLTTSMFRSPSTTLMSPIVPKNPNQFMFDLSSIVQIEREKAASSNNSLAAVHNHHHLGGENNKSSSRLMIIKEKMKLKRVKSGIVLNSPPTNLPHSHQHI